MATLKAVSGATDANSFATRDQAVAIFEGRTGTRAWALANEAKRDAALIEATAEFEQRFTWRGEKTSTTQSLSFPRSGLSVTG